MARKPKQPKQDDRCQHTTADGRRCRTSRMNQHSSLCLQHGQRQQELLHADSVCAGSVYVESGDANVLAAELLGPCEEFKSATAINHVLGKLFALLAKNRIPTRNAAILAYIGQVLLNSLALMSKEILRGEENAGWRQIVHHCPRPQRPAPRKTTRQGSVTPDKDDEQQSRITG